jgi:hypothetical protein
MLQALWLPGGGWGRPRCLNPYWCPFGPSWRRCSGTMMTGHCDPIPYLREALEIGYRRAAVLCCVVAADEFSALGTMSIGIFPRPAVSTHFELSRAATWTGAILGLVNPPTAKRGA